MHGCYANRDALLAAVALNESESMARRFRLTPGNIEGLRQALIDFGCDLTRFLLSREHLRFVSAAAVGAGFIMDWWPFQSNFFTTKSTKNTKEKTIVSAEALKRCLALYDTLPALYTTLPTAQPPGPSRRYDSVKSLLFLRVLRALRG